jgi:hypothetical protein
VNQVCDTAAAAAGPSTSPPLLLLLFLRLNLLSEEQLLPTLIPGRSCECKAAINSLLPLSEERDTEREEEDEEEEDFWVLILFLSN